MNFLKQERAVLAQFFPTLDQELAETPLLEMEKPGNPGLELFRHAGGPKLLIPTDYAGLGATPLQAIQIQRAIASRSPSLAIATTMHHFSVATMVEMHLHQSGGMAWMLLEAIAIQNFYVASGFAEGQPNTGILNSQMQVQRTDKGLVISGSKKPCSLSYSMDLLTASVVVPGCQGEADEFAVIIIPAATPGIERQPFWSSPILAGAESEAVILNQVEVEEQLVTYNRTPGALDFVQMRGFLWFELLIAASYLGMASALVERLLISSRGTAGERAGLAIEIEAAMSALEGVAHLILLEQTNHSELARALSVRFMVQAAIERVTARSLELMGGMAFINTPEIAYLFSAAHALGFHPPSRLSILPGLDQYYSTDTLLVIQ